MINIRASRWRFNHQQWSIDQILGLLSVLLLLRMCLIQHKCNTGTGSETLAVPSQYWSVQIIVTCSRQWLLKFFLHSLLTGWMELIYRGETPWCTHVVVLVLLWQYFQNLTCSQSEWQQNPEHHPYCQLCGHPVLRNLVPHVQITTPVLVPPRLSEIWVPGGRTAGPSSGSDTPRWHPPGPTDRCSQQSVSGLSVRPSVRENLHFLEKKNKESHRNSETFFKITISFLCSSSLLLLLH